MRSFVIALALGLAGLALSGQPAKCVYCPTYKCYGSCGVGCACVTPPGQMGGACYGIQQAQQLEAQGYRVSR